MLKNRIACLIILGGALLAVSACATVPTGPSVMVMPGPGKPFDLFQQEDVQCRQYAQQQIGAYPQDTINKNTAAGAAIGGAAGAALGSLSHTGSGLAFGAITGALFGAAVGSGQGQYYGYEAQRRYDIAYMQCMYANGNIIPSMRRVRHARRTPPPPGEGSVPPDYQNPSPPPPGAESAPPPIMPPPSPEQEPSLMPAVPPPAP